MLFLPFALFAQYVDAAYGIRIDESFEKGIPAGWTQENVSGSVNWVGESQNLTYPTGAADSLARVAFRNTSGVTNKAVTRLILPAVDVASLFQPILVFSHAQDKWSGDFESNATWYREQALSLKGKNLDLLILPELFHTPYFPFEENADFFNLAIEKDHPLVKEWQDIAKTLNTVIVFPFFEKRANGIYHNSAFVFVNLQK